MYLTKSGVRSLYTHGKSKKIAVKASFKDFDAILLHHYVAISGRKMNITNEIYELYYLISSGVEQIPNRKRLSDYRKAVLENQCVGLHKVAFDTRRINQETDYIPRRGLQNYHRSEKFISDNIASKIAAFKKLSLILDQLKSEYGKNPEWNDSYTRVLASAVHRGLRTLEADDDFSDAQPSMASLDYLEELMYVRYRMTPDDLVSINDTNLRTAILAKDELLTKNSSVAALTDFVVTPSDISKHSYDDMVNKMLSTMAQVMSSYKPAQPDDNLTNKLFDVKATKDTPEIERTVTITIKDKVTDREMSKVSEVKPAEIVISADDDIE